MEILEHDHCFYTLRRDEKTNEFFLEVECGTTAVFTILIKLTAAEINKYEIDPQSIRTLAYSILDYPGEYTSRRL
ncbi:hypothetical protein BH10ACI2_BH10ACI2_11730 [soil metagenome]